MNGSDELEVRVKTVSPVLEASSNKEEGVVVPRANRLFVLSQKK